MPTRRVNREDCRPKRRKRLDCLRHRVGNVAELRSRNMGSPRPAIWRMPSGPFAEKNSRPSFTPPASSRTASASSFARARSGVSMATKMGFTQSAPVPRSAFPAGRRYTIALHRIDSTAMGPNPCPHHQPGRQEAEQEDDDQKHGQFDVRLDVAPEVHRNVDPVSKRKQDNDHREEDPEDGLQKLHGGAFKPAMHLRPAAVTLPRELLAFVARKSCFVAMA